MNEQDRVVSSDVLQNKYSLVRGVARRARQLQSGALPLVTVTSTKACRVARDEIRLGYIRYTVTPQIRTVTPPIV